MCRGRRAHYYTGLLEISKKQLFSGLYFITRRNSIPWTFWVPCGWLPAKDL
jgi:hypothetical protein